MGEKYNETNCRSNAITVDSSCNSVYRFQKLNSYHPRVLCAKFGWNWPIGSWEDCEISSMCFRYFVIISLWKREWPFIWTNLNPHHLRKLDWNWQSGSLVEHVKTSRICFSLFHNYLPLEKGMANRRLCAKFGWNWPSGSRKEDENVKCLRWTDRGTNDGLWAIRESENFTWASAQVS